MKTWIIAFAAGLALISANTAEACMPVPPPPQEEGESAEAYQGRVTAWQAQRDAENLQFRHNQQVRLWDEADSIILARIERVQPNANDYGPRVTLRGIRTLKGRGYTNRFTLNYTEATSCGPLPAFDAVQGNVGDVYVIYIRGGRPNQRRVQGTVAPSAVIEERARILVSAG